MLSSPIDNRTVPAPMPATRRCVRVEILGAEQLRRQHQRIGGTEARRHRKQLQGFGEAPAGLARRRADRS